MECHFQLAGRPKGISFSSGRAKTDRTTPKTPKTWLAMLTHQAIGNTGNWQHFHIGNIPPLPCAAKMAAFPVKLRAQALTGTAAFQAAAFPATNH